MPDSLEAMLTDDEIGGNPGASEGIKLSELVKELNTVLNESTFYAKSNITHRNLRGILKANAFQDYLHGKYGFRIKVLDGLIQSKMENVLSVNGLGRKEIADMISKGTVKIEAKSGLDIGDRLFGGQPR